MQTAELAAQPTFEFLAFQSQQLVLVHLPDPDRNHTLIPVPGVVVTPGTRETVVRIRSLAGTFKTISVNTNTLSER